MHYLYEELQQLVRDDNAVLDFLEASSLDGMWYWDLENPEHEWMSPSFWLLLGRDPEKMPHRADAWQDLANPADLATAIENFELHCANPAHPYDQTMRYRHANGSTVTVRCRGMAIRDKTGKPIRMLGAHNDLTDLKRTEEALRATNRELARARDRAESASIAKTSFLATLSHEIRTPLNGVLGMASALATTDLTKEQSAMLDVVNRSGERLVKLLTDVLHLSKIEAGKVAVQSEPFDIVSLCEEVVALYAPIAVEKGIDLTLDTSSIDARMAIAPVERISQMLTNIVSNAVKFTAEGSVRVVAVTEPQPHTGALMLVLRVIDSGPGVAANRKRAIFDAFSQQSLRTSTDYGGTGLGLTIVRSICALLDGRIDIEDTPGGGATFTLSVPIRQSEDVALSSVETECDPYESLAELPPLRVLIAEDNETNRLVISALLATTDVELTIVEDGQYALDILSDQEFDAALIDIRMPRVDGLTVARATRGREASERRPPMPLIAFTANVMESQIQAYADAGFDATLPKPVDVGTLARCLTQVASGVPLKRAI